MTTSGASCLGTQTSYWICTSCCIYSYCIMSCCCILTVAYTWHDLPSEAFWMLSHVDCKGLLWLLYGELILELDYFALGRGQSSMETYRTTSLTSCVTQNSGTLCSFLHQTVASYFPLPWSGGLIVFQPLHSRAHSSHQASPTLHQNSQNPSPLLHLGVFLAFHQIQRALQQKLRSPLSPGLDPRSLQSFAANP